MRVDTFDPCSEPQDGTSGCPGWGWGWFGIWCEESHSFRLSLKAPGCFFSYCEKKAESESLVEAKIFLYKVPFRFLFREACGDVLLGPNPVTVGYALGNALMKCVYAVKNAAFASYIYDNNILSTAAV